jgi:hypothetical protein
MSVGKDELKNIGFEEYYQKYDSYPHYRLILVDFPSRCVLEDDTIKYIICPDHSGWVWVQINHGIANEEKYEMRLMAESINDIIAIVRMTSGVRLENNFKEIPNQAN